MQVNKKYILILGGTGFLGLNIINHYQNQRKEGGLENLFFLVISKTNSIVRDKNIIPIQMDFTNKMEMRNLFITYAIDEVFHLISTTIPATSNANIHNDVKTNLLSTLNLLDLMNEFNIKKIIYFSSGGTIYGDNNIINYQEDNIKSPNNSYSILKLSIENYIILYHKQYGINYLILRISNPFGMFHKSEVNGLINIAIRKSLKGKPIEIWGDGNSTKDYIFASDLANVFWHLKSSNIYNDVINIGSGQYLSINEIIQHIKNVIPQTNWLYQDKKIFDTHSANLSIEKLKARINFSFTTFEKSIESTIIWEKKFIK